MCVECGFIVALCAADIAATGGNDTGQLHPIGAIFGAGANRMAALGVYSAPASTAGVCGGGDGGAVDGGFGGHRVVWYIRAGHFTVKDLPIDGRIPYGSGRRGRGCVIDTITGDFRNLRLLGATRC